MSRSKFRAPSPSECAALRRPRRSLPPRGVGRLSSRWWRSSSAARSWPRSRRRRAPAAAAPAPGGWVLDGWGGLHRFGSAPAVTGGAYWPGWDIARGVGVKTPGPGGWVLDGWGGLHPVRRRAGGHRRRLLPRLGHHAGHRRQRLRVRVVGCSTGGVASTRSVARRSCTAGRRSRVGTSCGGSRSTTPGRVVGCSTGGVASTRSAARRRSPVARTGRVGTSPAASR